MFEKTYSKFFSLEKKNKLDILYFIKEVNKENDEKETPLYKGI